MPLKMIQRHKSPSTYTSTVSFCKDPSMEGVDEMNPEVVMITPVKKSKPLVMLAKPQTPDLKP